MKVTFGNLLGIKNAIQSNLEVTNNLQVAPKFFKEIGSIEESKTNVTLSLENGVKELIQEGKDRKYLGTGWADLKVQEESEEEVKAVV